MALKLKQTPLEWFNPEGKSLICSINVFTITNSSTYCQAIAISNNYDIIYYGNVSFVVPSGSVIGNLLTLMSVESSYVSNLKIRRSATGKTGDKYLIVEFTNPEGQYEYKMLCFDLNSEGGITLNFINTHAPSSRSNITEIIFSNNYIGFLFDLNTIYTYHKAYAEYSRYEDADNTSFSNVVENISNYIDTVGIENNFNSAGFTYNNETISFGRFDCNGQTWSMDSQLTVPIAQGQYFITNKSSFLSAGMDSLIYFINYSNNTLSVVSVNGETFVIFNVSSIECNTPINNMYTTYIYNPESVGLLSLLSNQDFTNLIQVVNETTTYTATFRNYDNTLLYETEVNAGETPSYVGPIPTRQSDNLYDYTFTGWNPELAPIIQDTTYIAQFSPVRKQVQVTFKNYNGTILEQKNIDKGTKPTYTGETPSRPADPYYTYYFKGWEPELGIVMSDTIYTATYSQTAKSYQCKFVDYDGTVISSIYVNAGEYATPPEFKGTQTGYSFVGWNPDPLTTQILEVTTFNAVYVKGIAINLYVNSAENGRVDKTNYLNQVGTLYGIFKEETSIMKPEIIIEYGVIDFNYIYIPLLNRYYYVNEIISVRNNLWKIRLNCDVLMSFKSDILNLECYVSRNEYTYNEYIEDDFLPLEYDKQVEEYIPTTPTNLEPYQFIDNYVVFITTIYSGDTNNFDYVDIKQSTVPFDIPNINPVSTYEQGSTAFKVAQFIPTDRGEGLEQNLSRFIDLIQGDDTVASYILSVVALPINFPSVNNPFWNEIIQRNNLLIGNDELSNIFDIQTDIGKTGAIPMFCNAKFTITGKYGSFLDYEPYTKYEIFLPYYGWLTLNSCDILNKNIYVAYLVQTDSSNGSVYVLTDDKVIFTSTCSIGVQFAISTTNRERINRERDANLINMTVGAWSGVGTMILGGFSKSPMAVGIGANKLVGSITSGITKCMTLMESASSKIGDGVAGAWSPRKVRVRITYPEIGVDDLEKYSKYIGRPLQENYTLNELNGYTIVGGVHVENIGLATEEEKTEIERTLRSGFILPDKAST